MSLDLSISVCSPVLAPRNDAPRTSRCWDMPLIASHVRKQSKLILSPTSIISPTSKQPSPHHRSKSGITSPTYTYASTSTSTPSSPCMSPSSWTSATSPTSISRSMTPKSSTTPTPIFRSITPKSRTPTSIFRSITPKPSTTPTSPTMSASSLSQFSPTTVVSAASTPGSDGLHSLTQLLHDGEMHMSKTRCPSWEHHDISQQAQHIQKQYQTRMKINERATLVKIQGQSEIVNENMLKKLLGMTPDRHLLNEWQLKYSMTRDGVSYSRFFHNLHEEHGSVVIMSDVDGSVFGGYAPCPWVKENEEIYYGTGEAFVYRIQGKEMQLYPWSGKNDFFMLSSKSRIAMGGGGSSGACRTFDSPCLASSHNFTCVRLEVWAPSGSIVWNDT